MREIEAGDRRVGVPAREALRRTSAAEPDMDPIYRRMFREAGLAG